MGRMKSANCPQYSICSEHPRETAGQTSDPYPMPRLYTHYSALPDLQNRISTPQSFPISPKLDCVYSRLCCPSTQMIDCWRRKFYSIHISKKILDRKPKRCFLPSLAKQDRRGDGGSIRLKPQIEVKHRRWKLKTLRAFLWEKMRNSGAEDLH